MGSPDLGHPGDLLLATAALAGDPSALAALDALLADVAPALRGLVPDGDRDDVLQTVRARLLLPRGERGPALAEYAGRGPLRAWLRVAVTRAGLDERRRAVPGADEADWLAIPAADPDPALRALRAQLGPRFRVAIERAVAALEPRARLLLRQHVLDGLSVPELAALHGVHRVTAFRWLAGVRREVVAALRRQLQHELGASPREIDSLLREIRASFAPSVERVLGTDPDGI